MQSLMELTDDYVKLQEYAGSLEPEDQQAFLDTLEGLDYEVGLKLDDYVSVIKAIESNEDLIETEIGRLKKISQALDDNKSKMKSAIKSAMEQMDKKEITGKFHKIKIVKNGGKQPLIITDDVPNNYQKLIFEDDTEKIRKALESGEELSFAYLGERGTHLKID